MSKGERKWVIGFENRFGPFESIVIPIPRHWQDETWWFVEQEETAVPPSRVFDTPQEAVLAAVEANNEKISRLELSSKLLRDWYDRLENERMKIGEQAGTTEQE